MIQTDLETVNGAAVQVENDGDDTWPYSLRVSLGESGQGMAKVDTFGHVVLHMSDELCEHVARHLSVARHVSNRKAALDTAQAKADVAAGNVRDSMLSPKAEWIEAGIVTADGQAVS